MITKRGVKDAALFIIQQGPSPGGPVFMPLRSAANGKAHMGKRK